MRGIICDFLRFPLSIAELQKERELLRRKVQTLPIEQRVMREYAQSSFFAFLLRSTSMLKLLT
jgi:hypothetical protein